MLDVDDAQARAVLELRLRHLAPREPDRL